MKKLPILILCLSLALSSLAGTSKNITDEVRSKVSAESRRSLIKTATAAEEIKHLKLEVKNIEFYRPRNPVARVWFKPVFDENGFYREHIIYCNNDAWKGIKSLQDIPPANTSWYLSASYYHCNQYIKINNADSELYILILGFKNAAEATRCAQNIIQWLKNSQQTPPSPTNEVQEFEFEMGNKIIQSWSSHQIMVQCIQLRKGNKIEVYFSGEHTPLSFEILDGDIEYLGTGWSSI